MADEAIAEVQPVALRHCSWGSMYHWRSATSHGKTYKFVASKMQNAIGADARAAMGCSGVPETVFSDEEHAQRVCGRCALRLRKRVTSFGSVVFAVRAARKQLAIIWASV